MSIRFIAVLLAGALGACGGDGAPVICASLDAWPMIGKMSGWRTPTSHRRAASSRTLVFQACSSPRAEAHGTVQ